jgi:hypothetical protein
MFTDYYGEALMGEMVVFALVNRRNNDHHASIVINTPLGPPSVREITGKQNLSALPRYIQLLRDFVNSLYGPNVEVQPNAELSLGRLTIDGVSRDLFAGDTFPAQVENKLHVWHSNFPIRMPDSFTFAHRRDAAARAAHEVELLNREICTFSPNGDFFEYLQTRRMLEQKGWLKDAERDARALLPPIKPRHFPIAIVSDSANVTFPKEIVSHGNLLLDRTKAVSWPETIEAHGDFSAAKTNIKLWRKGWRVYGRIDMRGAALEEIEPGSRFYSTADLSGTPLRGFPDGFVSDREITAHDTPHLHHIGRLCDLAGIDLTRGGLRSVDDYCEIDGDFITDFTKEFRSSPRGFIVNGSYFARECELAEIGAGTSVGFSLLLRGSRVTHLPHNLYVGFDIEGPDGKTWLTQDLSPREFTGLIDRFNEFYTGWKKPEPPREQPRPEIPRALTP